MMGAMKAPLFAAAVLAGLAAGLFFTYFFSVMPGLRRADDRTFVTAMNHLNAAVTNGWFALVFAGAPVAAAVAAALSRGPARAWAVGALGLQVAQLVVTFAVNVPLNNALAAADAAQPAAARAAFEGSWVRWNVARTAATVAAFGCLCAGLLAA
jgi:uncharacterized membrane protein